MTDKKLEAEDIPELTALAFYSANCHANRGDTTTLMSEAHDLIVILVDVLKAEAAPQGSNEIRAINAYMKALKDAGVKV